MGFYGSGIYEAGRKSGRYWYRLRVCRFTRRRFLSHGDRMERGAESHEKIGGEETFQVLAYRGGINQPFVCVDVKNAEGC